MSIEIIGIGSALPAHEISSEDLDRQLGKASGWVFAQSGVKTRHFAQEQSQIDLARSAVEAALVDAGITAQDVDLVLSASGIPYQTLPSTAPKVMAELGIADGAAAAFDVNSTCLSFLNGLETAAHLIQSGRHRCAVIVSSEIASRALPWDNQPETAALFGDGAAAVVLRQTERGETGLIASAMRTFPSAYDACSIGAGGTKIDYHREPDRFAAEARFSMDGATLFKLTRKHFNRFVDQLLQDAGWSKEDVDIVIPHQASPLALQHLVKSTGFDAAKVVNICKDYGNQIAASMPFALSKAHVQGKIKEGTRALFLGTSAGVSFGGVAWVF